MKTNISSYTVRYSLLNILYFIAFCTVHAYAAVYLLAHGFSNSEVGTLLAVANITSAVCQPFVATLIDKQSFLTNRSFSLFAVFVIAAGSLVLMAVRTNKIIIFVVYALIYMIQFVYQPILTAICFEYQKVGCSINYGLSRGLGSAGFAVCSALIGSVVEARGVFILLIVNVAAMAASAVVLLLFKKPDVQKASVSSAEPGTSRGRSDTAAKNIVVFAGLYPAYALFMLATVCFFFAHNMINDFMIQIIRTLGGAETQLGYSNFLQAILELPVMALMGLILKRVSAKRVLMITAIAFFIKPFILIFARSMAGMYISQSFQIFAYAAFVPAAAYYVSNTMNEFDQVKGQAFITTAITVGGIFSNIICGRILDSLGMRPMLITGTAVCAAGVVIAFVAMTLLKDRKA